jgi:hypothetical protein
MEVATIITSDKDVLSLFHTFIYSFPMVQFIGKDHDTAFFHNKENIKDKLYYHFKLDDVEQELNINYKKSEIIQIKNFFGEKVIYMFDLSYTLEHLLTTLFKSFKEYLIQENEYLIATILIGHPFEGIKSFESEY